MFQAPEELFDAAAADAFGADVERRRRGVKAIEVGHFVVAGDDADGVAVAIVRLLLRWGGRKTLTLRFARKGISRK